MHLKTNDNHRMIRKSLFLKYFYFLCMEILGHPVYLTSMRQTGFFLWLKDKESR